MDIIILLFVISISYTRNNTVDLTYIGAIGAYLFSYTVYIGTV